MRRATRSKTKHRENRARQRRARDAQPADNADSENAHWLTPAVYNRRCDSCGNKGSIAYRHSDQTSLCELCLERLGIEPRESRRWKRAASGSSGGPPVL